ncbi:Flp family type IVb pilin [Duganella aceris]|uniref:Flp family type IVb pilin n=1 Tax=Duganella aceris TaxID=2703883 RepID=A0ABX0FPU4_9BURK|nr:Flp family type IVb pilin [Duganella aceris]NGZ86497.1 Flp family type IVb pilin [Duganella aceris]
MNAIKNFIADEAGITAIEYALLAAAIAAAVITAASGLGTKIGAAFTALGNKLA